MNAITRKITTSEMLDRLAREIDDLRLSALFDEADGGGIDRHQRAADFFLLALNALEQAERFARMAQREVPEEH